MFKKLNIQMIGVSVLIAAAMLISLSAIRLPVQMSSGKVLIPVSGNEAGLAQYHRSEWGSASVVENGLGIYYQSERVQAYPAKSNEAGLAQYHRSERESGIAIQNGLEKYHQSEWQSQ
jgi:hypothetical protein